MRILKLPMPQSLNCSLICFYHTTSPKGYVVIAFPVCGQFFPLIQLIKFFSADLRGSTIFSVRKSPIEENIALIFSCAALNFSLSHDPMAWNFSFIQFPNLLRLPAALLFSSFNRSLYKYSYCCEKLHK